MLPKRQIRFFYLSSKCVVKQQRQLATPTTHVAEELLMNIQHVVVQEVLQRREEP